MDISADLTELSRTPVAVVCAGAKSVSLPVGKTHAGLEARGSVRGCSTASLWRIHRHGPLSGKQSLQGQQAPGPHACTQVRLGALEGGS